MQTKDNHDDHGPDVRKGRRSAVYVLAGREGNRPTTDVSRNAVYAFFAGRRDDLPEDCQQFLDDYDAKDEQTYTAIRRWATAFLDALDDGVVLDTDYQPLDNRDDWSTRVVALYHLATAGAAGVTSAEVRNRAGVSSDGISGSLSHLHAAGVAVRLEERR